MIKNLSIEIGSTALIVIIVENILITANLGDSRAILCRNNEPF